MWIHQKPFTPNPLVLQPPGNTTFKSKSIDFKKGTCARRQALSA